MKKKKPVKKKPMTVSEMASMGGKARAAKLTPERRQEIGLNAIKARYAKANQPQPE